MITNKKAFLRNSSLSFKDKRDWSLFYDELVNYTITYLLPKQLCVKEVIVNTAFEVDVYTMTIDFTVNPRIKNMGQYIHKILEEKTNGFMYLREDVKFIPEDDVVIIDFVQVLEGQNPFDSTVLFSIEITYE
jgi:hypothetical protein